MSICRKCYPSDVSAEEWSLVAPYLLLQREDAGQREHDLRAVLRLAAGHQAEPTAAIIDSRTPRSTPESGERAGYDGAKRKKGSKIHMAVDTLSHMLALHVTPASARDRGEVERLARVPYRRSPATRSSWPGWTRAIPVTGPPRPQPGTPSRWRSSNCHKPNAASSSCQGAGSWSDHSPGQPAS